MRTHQPNPANRVPNVTSQLPKVEHRVPAQKDAPKFEVANPRIPNDKQRNQVPQYKYATEIMNGINQESVFQKLLSQPVMMKLGDLLSVEVATRASYFGQWTIFGVISHLFPTITFFHFFRITVQAGIPAPSFSSVLLLDDLGPDQS